VWERNKNIISHHACNADDQLMRLAIQFFYKIAVGRDCISGKRTLVYALIRKTWKNERSKSLTKRSDFTHLLTIYFDYPILMGIKINIIARQPFVSFFF
jgi:hypothetical protein